MKKIIGMRLIAGMTTITLAWCTQNRAQAVHVPQVANVNQIAAYTAPGATEQIIRFNPAGKQLPGTKVDPKAQAPKQPQVRPDPVIRPRVEGEKPPADPIVLPRVDVVRPKVNPPVTPIERPQQPKRDPAIPGKVNIPAPTRDPNLVAPIKRPQIPKGEVVIPGRGSNPAPKLDNQAPRVDLIRPQVVRGGASPPPSERSIDRQVVKLPVGQKLDPSKQTVPGLNLGNTQIDANALNRLKAPINLNNVKPETVLNAKPPADFKPHRTDLNKIHIPNNAAHIERMTHATVKPGHNFVLNKLACQTGNYHLKCGTAYGGGYCYVGAHHCHWHHSIYDPCFKCNYFYCPSACGYYYWCQSAATYYPCHWFVNHCNCYYPWWLCGGFSNCGYVAPPCNNVYVCPPEQPQPQYEQPHQPQEQPE